MATPKVSKKIQEMIKTATPKQKAILVTRDWTDKNKLREEPLLTEEEVKAIINSLSPEEGREFNKWIRYYNVYVDIAPLMGLAISQYREQAEEIVGYLRLLESYAQEENHLNTIFETLKESANETALAAFDTALKSLHFKFTRLQRDEDGYINLEEETILNAVREKVKGMGFSYGCLKAFIIAVDEWTTKHKSKKLMPVSLAENMDDIRNDNSINIAPTYSRKFLKERIAKGLKPTIAEEKKALFPCYDDIPIMEEYVGLWKERLDSVNNSLKNAR